jgi:hypothetical protein
MSITTSAWYSEPETHASLFRWWPGLARPPTIRGTCPSVTVNARHWAAQGRARTVRERLNHPDVSKPSSVSWPVPRDPRGARSEDKPGQGEKVLFLFVQSGAAGGYRTYDLSLTKGVLYH